jgi:hypothetical protein
MKAMERAVGSELGALTERNRSDNIEFRPIAT